MASLYANRLLRCIKEIEEAGYSRSTIKLEELSSIAKDSWFTFDFDQIYTQLANILREEAASFVQKVMTRELTIDAAEEKWITDSSFFKINQMLSFSELDFQITSPWGLKPSEPYLFRFINSEGTKVGPNDLSTGENTILKILMLTFIYSSEIGRPKLILLDEQDAHLEPSVIPSLLNAITKVLISEYKAVVIMATHRSETIALAPENCLFELRKNPSEVRRVNKDSIISKISDNLFKIWTEGQVVLVEGDDDQRFYSNAYEYLKGPYPALAEKRLSFISVSNKKRTGGCSVVESHVEKMKGFAKGLLDGDNTPKEKENIYQIKRHSIENYCFDPHILLSCIVADGKLHEFPEITFVEVPDGGQLNSISNLPESELQSFANVLYSKIKESAQTEITEQSDELLECEYTNGKKLKIPKWIYTTQGHKLLGVIKSCLKLKVFSMENLRSHQGFQKEMIPIEIYDTIFRL
jgi:hypothetical protein